MNTTTLMIGRHTFDYQRCSVRGDWNAVPIIYLFCVDGADGRTRTFIPYIGETGNAQTRFPDHDRWEEAVKDYGVSHILACIAPYDQDQRRELEKDFIKALNPPMNTHHKPETNGMPPLFALPRRAGLGLINTAPSNSLTGLYGLGGLLRKP